MENFNVNIDLIRGHVDTIILRSIFNEDKYGLEILSYIKEKSDNMYCLKQPTLYSCLKRLEKIGYISSYKGDTSNGAKRVYYTLLPAGRDYVMQDQYQWEFSRTIIDNLLSDKDFDPAQKPPFNPSEFRPLTKRMSGSQADALLDFEPIDDKQIHDDDLPYSNNENNSIENDDENNFVPNTQPKNFNNIVKAIESGLNNESLPEVETKVYNQISFETGKQKTSIELNEEILAKKINEKTKEYDYSLLYNDDNDNNVPFDNPTLKYEEKVKKIFFDEETPLVENANCKDESNNINNQNFQKFITTDFDSNIEKNFDLQDDNMVKNTTQSPQQTNNSFNQNDCGQNYNIEEKLVKNGGVLFNNYNDNIGAGEQQQNKQNFDNRPNYSAYSTQAYNQNIYAKTTTFEDDSNIDKKNNIENVSNFNNSTNIINTTNDDRNIATNFNALPTSDIKSLESKQDNNKNNIIKDTSVNYIKSFSDIYSNQQHVAPATPKENISYVDVDYLTINELKNKLNNEGFSLKPYQKNNAIEFFANKYYYQSKVLFFSSLVFYLLMAIEAITIFFATKNILPHQLTLLIICLTLPVAYPLYATIKLLLNPKFRKPTKFSLKSAITTSMIFVINAAIIIVCLAFLVFGATFSNINTLINPLIVPLLLLLNIPIAVLIYQIIYSSKKFFLR